MLKSLILFSCVLSVAAHAEVSATSLLASGSSSVLTATAKLDYSEMTREQLLRARAEIAAARPSLAPNVLLLILTPTVGGGLTAFLIIVAYGVGAVIGTAICVAAIVLGIVRHAMISGDRARANVELEIIDGLLDSGQPLPAQPALPPPPPPPPAALGSVPPPSLALFAF